MKKKIFSITLLLILLFSTNIFATSVSSENATLEIIKDNICTINIKDNAIFEKKIINSNLENKELTIGLQISNNAIAPLDKPSEIVLVMDNSLSMKETISTDGSRMEAVSNSAKLLATELLKLDTVKISLVSFSTGSDEGTITDAKLRVSLTNSIDTILDGITEIANDATGVRTDIEAGITLASQQFTGTCENKFIILLTDGVPNISLGTNKIQYSGVTATNTKNALIALDTENIQILSMMTGVSDDIETQTGMTYKTLAEEVFGTPQNPTVGKFYYITDDEIEETVSKTILNQLIAPEDDILTDIDIYDYFPQEIVDNFNFEYVKTPNIGEVSEDIDLQNNMIVWHIDELSYGEIATLSYKLTLKDTINTEIVDINLNTNQKVEITTDKILDENGTKKVLVSDVSPIVKVTIEQDTTIVPEPTMPQTGVTINLYVLLAISLITCIAIGIRAYIKSKQLHKF